MECIRSYVSEIISRFEFRPRHERNMLHGANLTSWVRWCCLQWVISIRSVCVSSMRCMIITVLWSVFVTSKEVLHVKLSTSTRLMAFASYYQGTLLVWQTTRRQAQLMYICLSVGPWHHGVISTPNLGLCSGWQIDIDLGPLACLVP